MKRLFTLIVTVALTIVGLSQIPEKMSYQAVIRNASGELLKGSPVGIKISILQGSATGTPVYVETQNPTTNANGLVTIEIGGGTPVTGTFKGIDWSTGMYFIKTEVDALGSTNYTITGTSQLLSVPYALYAKTSERLTNFTVSTTGDTMSFGRTKIIIPGISAANPPIVANTDIDGNLYDTVRIGTQTWMKENLRVTKFNDGTVIPLPTYDYKWPQLITPGYCWYNNDISNKDTYGALYNWWAANSGKLCPVGWHVPTVDEWEILGHQYRHTGGIELLETGTSHWINGSGTNTTGFTAVPGGARGSVFSGIGEYGNYWTFNAPDYMYSGFVWHYPIPWDGAWGMTPTSTLTNPQGGLSVRCLKN
jgi:uncharacterized protein (TIGR02145 family)